MKILTSGREWCAAITAAAIVMFALAIWQGDGRYAGIGWLCVVAALIAGVVGISQAVGREGRELKKHLALSDYRTLEFTDTATLPDSAVLVDATGVLWQKWTRPEIGGPYPVFFRPGAIDPITLTELFAHGPLKLLRESTGQAEFHPHPDAAAYTRHPSEQALYQGGAKQAREGRE
ncbi:membrane protein [Arthrobacter phage KBurrousTX]|uniref:Membrane protein n=1 Tax=Arthrobacter phage KBurrousTX TaxID=2315608 RepID=A0A386K8I1_9CAUD|nr:membrane protein [Arthrobacter phage KBurrousTX]AYD81569.1 membrane protein [Arthrobacter phage KBurrousTX]